jgi:hypothetical protein
MYFGSTVDVPLKTVRKLKHTVKFAVNKEVYIIMLLYDSEVNFTLACHEGTEVW